MSALTRKGRAGGATLPENLPASADGDCGTSFLKPTATKLQAASAATPRCVRPIYLLRLQVQPDIDDIRALRWALKKLRRLGLRCISIVEVR
jgi:hypothetical protein